ncbi:MAG: FliM/FliN family flagellar motor switch protein [Edaphobacter sp.]|uniref:FliM/FliN family flagellar motor switch protein n=1 Tax=Edaphobacter sp. TaxID=1934404 RepID=UPI00239D675F|nr:FliM/FliN family flagellar motor switch protein [Edaphobacter sp.]MDE1178379.1 FliM/FliN family flagellar motor switch protein [Edaphobacter sp.]
MADVELVKAEVEVEMEQRIDAAKAEPPAGPGMKRIEKHMAWPVLSVLEMSVSAEIPLEDFKVRDLLALESGQLIASAWPETEDVTVMAGGVQAGWSEFEVEDQKLLVRLTRLA